MQINIEKYRNIVVLTGAGISVASGLKSYRGPGGIWDEHDVEKYGYADALTHYPRELWAMYGAMRAEVRNAKPNAAHEVLKKLEESLRNDQHFLLVTQNVDGLHYRAGSHNVVEIHGNINETRCANDACDLVPFQDDQAYDDDLPDCPICGGMLRPNVVLFGEPLPLDPSWRVKQALRDCDLFIAIGTSGVVEPVASYARSADYSGARTIYINLEPMQPRNPYFHEEQLGRAEEILPEIFAISS